LTVDGVVLGKRINEFRNSFTLPEGTTFPNIESKTNAASVEASGDGVNYGKIPSKQEEVQRANVRTDATPDWETVIPWLRSNTKLPIWLKGSKSGLLLNSMGHADRLVKSIHLKMSSSQFITASMVSLSPIMVEGNWIVPQLLSMH
jgi:hypothetical protein